MHYWIEGVFILDTALPSSKVLQLCSFQIVKKKKKQKKKEVKSGSVSSPSLLACTSSYLNSLTYTYLSHKIERTHEIQKRKTEDIIVF